MSTQKILVIDDSGVIRKTVRDMFPADKVEILEAKNGQEGLNLIRQEHPHVVMLDFILPKVSGWDVYQQIEGNQEFWDIALVIMSGRKGEVTGKIAEPFKYFSFIEKPFDQKGMFAAIKEAMEKAKKRPKPAPVTPPLESEIAPQSQAVDHQSIQELQQKMTKMQGEIDQLKKQVAQLSGTSAEIEKLKAQVTQLVTFIKQKLK